MDKEFAAYSYVTKSTFDAYNWSLVENKQRLMKLPKAYEKVKEQFSNKEKSVRRESGEGVE